MPRLINNIPNAHRNNLLNSINRLVSFESFITKMFNQPLIFNTVTHNLELLCSNHPGLPPFYCAIFKNDEGRYSLNAIRSSSLRILIDIDPAVLEPSFYRARAIQQKNQQAQACCY